MILNTINSVTVISVELCRQETSITIVHLVKYMMILEHIVFGYKLQGLEAKDSWCLCKLIHRVGENAVNYIITYK